jgi:two-component system CheB/CheR fusion protein
VKEQGRYRVRKEVRELVMFAPHDVLKDTPFSRLDLITCRNLLIYLKRDAQERVFDIFHFACGLAVDVSGKLGKHRRCALAVRAARQAKPALRQARRRAARLENPRVADSLVAAHNRAASRAARRAACATESARNGTSQWSAIRGATTPDDGNGTTGERRALLFGDLHLRLLEEYAPPSVIVNENYDIAHLSEHVGRFLQIAVASVDEPFESRASRATDRITNGAFRAVKDSSRYPFPRVPLNEKARRER